MVSTNVGRVNLDVEADGSLLNNQIRRIGRRAGHEAGKEFDKGFAAQVRPAMDDLFEKMGTSGAFRRFSKEVGGSDEAVRRLTKRLEDLRNGGMDTSYLTRMRVRLFDLRDAMNGGGGGGGVSGAADETGNAWKKMSFNFRQGVVIVGAVLSGLEQMAVLGSAAAAGLLVLGGAAAGALVGVGGLVAAFAVLAGDIKKVPDSIKPAAKAFQDLTKPLKEIQNTLAENAFAGTEVAFGKIGTAIRALDPAVTTLGKSINNVVNRFADWAASSHGITQMNGLIEKSGPIFEKLVGITGKLGDTLLAAFNSPSMQRAIDDMLNGIDGMFTTFDKFVKSDDFGTWMKNTMSVMGKLGELIGATSEMLNNLVTPEAYDRTNRMIENLASAMPGIGAFVEMLGRLDIFGVIAAAVDTFFNSMKPVFDMLAPLADVIGSSLITALDLLTVAFTTMGLAFMPFQIAFELVNMLIQQAITYLSPYIDSLKAMGDALKSAGDTIFEKMAPAFQEFLDKLFALLPTADEFTAWVNDTAIPAIEKFADWLGDKGAKAIEKFGDWILNEAIPAIEKLVDWFINDFIPAADGALKAVDRARKGFEDFGNGVKAVVNFITNPIKALIDLFNDLTGAARAASRISSSVNSGTIPTRKFASGGVLNSAQRIIAGEAGPEAIVPLRRNLNSVDPSVRWLSAVAQGKTPPAMASGGVVGGGRTNVVEAGAIVVQESRDGLSTSVEILNRLVRELN